MSYPKPSHSIPTEQQLRLNSLKLTPTQRKKILITHRNDEIRAMIVSKYLEKNKINLSLDPSLNSIAKDFVSSTPKLTERKLEELSNLLKKQIKDLNIHEHLRTDNEENVLGKGRNTDDDKKCLKTEENANVSKNKIKFKVYQKGVEREYEISETESEKSVYKTNENDNEWAAIVRFKQKKYEEDLLKERNIREAKKLKFKEELDHQINLKKKMANEIKEKEMEMQGRNREYNLTVEEKKKIAEEHKNKVIQEINKQKVEQIKNVSLRQKLEKKKDAEEEQFFVDKFKEELKREKDDKLKKKLEYQETLQKISQLNFKNKQITRETENSLERDIEQKAIVEDHTLTLRKENQKVIEKQERLNKYESLQKSISENYENKDLAKMRREEEILKKNLEEQELKVKKQKERKQQFEESNKIELKKNLVQQIQRKRELKTVEKEENNKQAEFWKNDTQDFTQVEEEKKKLVKNKNVQSMGLLKLQIEEKIKRKEVQKSMNDSELLQNKDILKGMVVESPNQTLVKTKVSPKKRT